VGVRAEFRHISGYCGFLCHSPMLPRVDLQLHSTLFTLLFFYQTGVRLQITTFNMLLVLTRFLIIIIIIIIVIIIVIFLKM
jgi:hypothetical protein